MGFLSRELKAVARENRIRQIEVTRKTDLSVAHISRVFSGEQVTVTDGDLGKIMDVIAKNPQQRARVIRARLRDAYQGPDAGLVKVILATNDKGAQGTNLRFPKMEPSIKAAFEHLGGLVPENPSVGQAILQLARMMGAK